MGEWRHVWRYGWEFNLLACELFPQPAGIENTVPVMKAIGVLESSTAIREYLRACVFDKKEENTTGSKSAAKLLWVVHGGTYPIRHLAATVAGRGGCWPQSGSPARGDS